MNYLAHAYLSFNHPQILVGNMISDYVKGKTQFDYPLQIQHGIQLHRAIDAFTDSHESTRVIKKLFAPTYRLYAGAFADVVYDYFLANDKTKFESDEALASFCQNTYSILQENKQHFPSKFLGILPYMITQNWLYNYQYDWGMQKSLQGVVRRSAYLTESDIAFNIFLQNKNLIHEQYNLYFPQLKAFTQNKLTEFLKP
jgi:acyl carrier protein phosphodiesterase